MDARRETMLPSLYDELADWWPLLSAPEEYAEEAAAYRDHLIDAAEHPVREVLELGSGGGNNASHLKNHFGMTLVDVSPRMLDVSRSVNPGCVHVHGDMRTVRLGRTFDAVFVHDAICYMSTEADLASAIETAAVHCATGGSLVIAPDHVAETYIDATQHGGHDGSGRALRYLDWTHDPDPSDQMYVSDLVYVLRTGATIEVRHDRHVQGLFPRALWLRSLDGAGFDARSEVLHLSDVTTEIFVGVKR